MGCEYTSGIPQDQTAHGRVDGPDKGIIPLTCAELFNRVEQKQSEDPNLKITVEVSYIEVSEREFYMPVTCQLIIHRFTTRKFATF